MEIVEYKFNALWVGHMDCPNCKSIIYAWQSSGMSESFPHFYCDKCSNVLLRESVKVWKGVSKEILKEIENSLPNCECGGKFSEWDNK